MTTTKYIPVILYETGFSYLEYRLAEDYDLRRACATADYALEHGVWVPNEDEDVWTFVRPDMIYELKVLKECDDDD